MLPRTLSSVIAAVSTQFPVLLLTGPRQVGKTTVLKNCSEPTRRFVTLDDLEIRALARNDPGLFFQSFPPPVIIDEAQYAPELFNAIKLMVDHDRQPGQFWLTGSQKFHLMQGISETLAGRIAILDLLGLSQAEISHRLSYPFLPSQEWIAFAESCSPQPKNLKELYEVIWRGSFPAVVLQPNLPWDIFYNSYVQTYIQRDVRALARIGDEMAFMRLLRACAARTGQLLNYASLSRDVDVDQKTIKSWLGILETSGLIYLLYPWHNNPTKRLIKTPKLYFLDTGLCSWLTQWSTPEALEAGAMSGAVLETWIFTEILKSYWHNGKPVHFYFYRDRDQREIDLLIEQDGKLWPVEFKKSTQPGTHTARGFSVLKHTGCEIGMGAVISLKQTALPLSKSVWAIPVGYL